MANSSLEIGVPIPAAAAPPDRSEFFDFVVDRGTIKRSAVNSVLIQLLLKLKGIITLPIFTYFLLPKDMGAFNLIMVSSSVLAPLLTLNLPDGSVLFFAREKSAEKIRSMYMTVIGTVGGFSLLLSALIFLAIYLFRKDLLGYAFWIALMIAAMIFFKLAEFILATFQKTGLLLKNALVREIGSALLAIALVALGLSYRGLVIAGSVFLFLTGIWLFKVIARNVRFTFSVSLADLKSFLKISLPLLPVFFFSWIIQSSDSYFLVYFRGEGVVGKYSIIYSLCNIILVLTFALNFFWFPVSARLWVENREKYRKAFSTVFFAVTTFLLMTVVLFELNSRLMMKILVRKTDYQDAYVIMGLIAFAFAMQVLITFLTAPLYSHEKPYLIFFSYLAGGLANVILNIILIPHSGIVGAAISTAASYLVVVVLLSYLDHRVCSFSFLDARLAYVSACLLAVWAAVPLLRGQLRFTQLVVADLGFLALAGALLYFLVLRKEEQEYIFSLLRGFTPGSGSRGAE